MAARSSLERFCGGRLATGRRLTVSLFSFGILLGATEKFKPLSV